MPQTFGPYELHEVLGKGGMGQVFRAYQPSVGRFVALKIVRDPGDREENYRLFRESTSTASLNHPNIVRVIDGGYHGDEAFLVTELLEGEPLHLLVNRVGAIPWQQALSIAAGILDGLAYLHGRSILHRDLKPANVILTRDGPKLIDFGLVWWPGATNVTRTGVVMGTPVYFAPELFEGSLPSANSDVWAAGAIFAELLTGRCRADGLGKPMELGWLLMDTPAFQREHLPEVPVELVGLLEAMVKRDPADRISSDEAARWARGLQGGAEPSQPTCRNERPIPTAGLKRTGLLRLIGVTLFLVLILSRWLIVSQKLGPDVVAAKTLAPHPEPPRRAPLFARWRLVAPQISKSSVNGRELSRRYNLPGISDLAVWRHWVRLGEWLDSGRGSFPLPAIPANVREEASAVFPRLLSRRIHEGVRYLRPEVMDPPPGFLSLPVDGPVACYIEHGESMLEAGLLLTFFTPQSAQGWLLLGNFLEAESLGDQAQQASDQALACLNPSEVASFSPTLLGCYLRAVLKKGGAVAPICARFRRASGDRTRAVEALHLAMWPPLPDAELWRLLDEVRSLPEFRADADRILRVELGRRALAYMDRGELPGAEALLEKFHRILGATELEQRLELCCTVLSASSQKAWLREFVTSCLTGRFRQSFEAWSEAAGGLATGAGASALEAGLANRTAGGSPDGFAAGIRAVWLGRCGRIGESLEALADAPHNFPSWLMCEILGRPYWYRSMGRAMSDADLALARSLEVASGEPSRSYARALREGRCKEAVRIMEELNGLTPASPDRQIYMARAGAWWMARFTDLALSRNAARLQELHHWFRHLARRQATGLWLCRELP